MQVTWAVISAATAAGGDGGGGALGRYSPSLNNNINSSNGVCSLAACLCGYLLIE